MKVAFWSNVRGKSCVTSNLACMSVLSALGRPGRRTIIFENHKNIINLGNTYFRPSSETVNEHTNYMAMTGMDKVLQFVRQDEALPEERFYRYTKELLGRQLCYLPAMSVSSPDILEYQMSRECKRTLRYLEQYGDVVLVDTSPAPLESSRKILQEADVVVVNLVQNESMLSHFFRNYSDIQKKAFYIIGNYEREQALDKRAIIQHYGVGNHQIGTVPHHGEYADALSSGRLVSFLSENYLCGRENPNYSFMTAVRETEALFWDRLGEKGNKG